MGRRAFLKKTGAATFAAALALQSTKTELLASESGLVKRRVYDGYHHQFVKYMSGTGAPEDEADTDWVDKKISDIDVHQMSEGGYRRACPYPGTYTHTKRDAWLGESLTLVEHWQKITVEIDDVGPRDEFYGCQVTYTVTVDNYYVYGVGNGPLDANGCPVTDPGKIVGPIKP